VSKGYIAYFRITVYIYIVIPLVYIILLTIECTLHTNTTNYATDPIYTILHILYILYIRMIRSINDYDIQHMTQIGSGTYGIVYKTIDKTNQNVSLIVCYI